MDYTIAINQYGPGCSAAEVSGALEAIREASAGNCRNDVYKLCYSAIDLTTLNVTDTVDSVRELTLKTLAFPDRFPAIPNVASICVFPNFVDTVGLALGDSGVKITSVAGGFPAAQTYLEVKMLEIAMAVENGADEIDIVLNLGEFLAGEFEQAANEISTIVEEIGNEVVLKVIIESGALTDPALIRKASLTAMLAGAGFVKTSTGKIPVAATPEAAFVICSAIRDYHANTGRKVGFKAAGGVKTPQDAALYYTIVEQILGPQWLDPSLFRIGASSAANNILSAIEEKEIKYY